MIGFRLQTTSTHRLNIDQEIVAPSIPRVGEKILYDGEHHVVRFVVHDLDANPPEVQVRI